MSFTPYQRKLFVFLSAATFFEGYDFFALAQILPHLRQDFDLDEFDAGLLFSVVNFGTLLGYFLVRKADQWGRRRVLTATIAGYTLLTLLSGLSPNAVLFTTCQMLARIFLIAEWAISAVIAAEEFPAARRGMVLGVIQGAGSLGAIVCAGVAPALTESEYGWRTVYFVGIVPLVLLAIARRGLKETDRFREAAAAGEAAHSMFAIWKTVHRRRVLQLGAIWFVAYLAMHNAVSFWKDFALNERGLSDKEAGLSIVVAAVGSMPLTFFSGKLADLVGRRHAAGIVFGLGALGVSGAYLARDWLVLTVSLTLAIFCAGGFLAVLNAFTSELFPTSYRASAFAWCNNLLGRSGYVLSPIAVGAVAERVGWAHALAPTALFAILAAVLVYAWLPETRGRELEETAQM
jgi:putative MFS transporter